MNASPVELAAESIQQREELMKKMTGILLLVAGLSLTGSIEARAQAVSDARRFVDINGGVQMLTPTLDSGSSFLLFGEADPCGRARISAPAALSMPGSAVGSAAGSVSPSPWPGSELNPQGRESPAFRVRFSSGVRQWSPSRTAGLKRREIGYHPQIVWFVPWSSDSTSRSSRDRHLSISSKTW